jgi:hypothetical protein
MTPVNIIEGIILNFTYLKWRSCVFKYKTNNRKFEFEYLLFYFVYVTDCKYYNMIVTEVFSVLITVK